MEDDRAYGPREGKSAISAKTRKRIYGGKGRGIKGGSTGSAYSQDDYEKLLSQIGGEGGDRNALGRLLMQLLGQQSAQPQGGEAADYLRTKAEVRDPVGWAIKQREAGNIARNADPWGPGGQFEGHLAADIYTPEEILASQGNTAQNQIMRMRQPLQPEQRDQLAGVPKGQRQPGEFDPEELQRQNRIYSANRTYM